MVHPEVGVWIKKGHILATIFDSFGDRIKEYFAMEDAVVIGKSVNPCAFAGDRIVHLGFVGGSLKKNQADGHD